MKNNLEKKDLIKSIIILLLLIIVAILLYRGY